MASAVTAVYSAIMPSATAGLTGAGLTTPGVGMALASAPGYATIPASVGAVGGAAAGGFLGFTTGQAIRTGVSVLGIGMQIAGAGQQIQAGQTQAQILRQQATMQDYQARESLIRGEEQANAIRRRLQQDLASQKAIFGARSVALSSGTARSAQIESQRAANISIQRALSATELTAAGQLEKGRITQLQAYEAERAGRIRAIGTIGGLLTRIF